MPQKDTAQTLSLLWPSHNGCLRIAFQGGPAVSACEKSFVHKVDLNL